MKNCSKLVILILLFVNPLLAQPPMPQLPQLPLGWVIPGSNPPLAVGINYPAPKPAPKTKRKHTKQPATPVKGAQLLMHAQIVQQMGPALLLSWNPVHDSVYLLYITPDMKTWTYKGTTTNTSITVGILPAPAARFYKVVSSNTVSHFTSVQTVQFLQINNLPQ